MPDHTHYRSPLETRNASAEMLTIWSPQRKFSTWRRLWLALAEGEKQLGLRITDEQIAQLREHLDDIDFQKADEYERRFRHDVMAHIHTYGDAAPAAREIIHLGATSQFVNCNTELMLLRDSLQLVSAKLAAVVIQLGNFALLYRDLPTLAFTHFQPAQPTTVGKRAAMWAQELILCRERLEHTRSTLKMRSIKGATGTQASFLDLFHGDAEKVYALEKFICDRFGFDSTYPATGQTYPRVVDAMVLSDLACTAAALHKLCSDLRLLAHRKEIEEPFEKDQVGSSAMPYKRNPMRCERATGLCRFVMNLAGNAYDTAATQWLERTLDDSANRRLSLPESFLALDGALDICGNVTLGLVVYEKTITRNLLAELPFMASENLMMKAVQLGRDRQQVHEAIRRHARDAAQRVKNDGADNDLLDRLRSEPLLEGVDIDAETDPKQFIGLAPQQVERFHKQYIQPLIQEYPDYAARVPKLRV